MGNKFINISKYTIISLLLFGGAASTAAPILSCDNIEVSAQKSTRTFYDRYPEIKQVDSTTDSALAVVNKTGQDHLIGWGLNQNGNLTSGNDYELIANDKYSWPVDITPDEWKGKEIKDVAISYQSGAAIIHDSKEDEDSLWTWGDNTKGLLANGTTDISENDLTPTEITYEGTEDWELIDVELGDNIGMISINDGTSDRLFTWGLNMYGATGVAGSVGSVIYPTPREVKFKGNEDLTWTIKDITTGPNDGQAAILNDGTVDNLYVWGHDSNYRFGINGDGAGYFTPQKVEYEGTEVEEVEFSAGNMFVISNDGTYDKLSISGSSSDGQIPGYNNKNVPVLVPVFTSTDENADISNIAGGTGFYHVEYTDNSGSNLYAAGKDKQLKTFGIDYSAYENVLNPTQSIKYSEPQLITFEEDVIDIKQVDTYINNTFIVGETEEFTKLFVVGPDEEFLAIPERESFDFSPKEVDFTYYNGEPLTPDTLVGRFGMFNFVTMIIMIIALIILLVDIVLLIFHKIHHKQHVEAIEEHGKTYLGGKDEE